MDAEVGVVGLGAAGSMALWQLASRGVEAVGWERHRPGHDRGSSHGESRIIRTAYHEGPQYVPLVREAWDLWLDLERQAGVRLLVPTGALYIGLPDSSVIRGVLDSAARHGVEHRRLGTAELAAAHPQHVLSGGEVGVLESQAGYLAPEAAVAAAAGRAAGLGARVRDQTEVHSIEPAADSVAVVTSRGTLTVGHVILSAGAWATRLLPQAGMPLEVERVVVAWWPVGDPELYYPSRCPVWIRDLPDGRKFYGFPSTDGATVKFARHHGGRPGADPDHLDREVRADDVDELAAYAAEHLAGIRPEPSRTSVCMYTNTPDGDFLLGSPAGLPRVTVLSACSGHGFKFAPVIGRIGADLATGRQPAHDLTPFSPDRFVKA